MKHSALLLFAILLFSCQTGVQRELKTADSLLNERPDSSLSIINRINEAGLTRQKNRAYYALLKSAARDKNYIDVTNDSLINIAVDYYSNHGSVYNRMRSRYYQGIVRENAKQYSSAIVSFEMANQDALIVKDLRFQGLIHRNMGYIFHSTSNYPEAIKQTYKAINAFKENNDSIFVEYAYYSLAALFRDESNHWDSCRLLLNEIIQSQKLEPIHADARLMYAYTLVVFKDSLQKALDIYQSTPRSRFQPIDYGLYSMAHAFLHHRDSAAKWMREAYQADPTPESIGQINSVLFRIDSLEGNFLGALQKIKQAMKAQDTRTRAVLAQSLSVAQRDYYQYETEKQQSKLRQQRILFAGGILFSALILCLFILFTRRKVEKQDARQKELMAQLALGKQEIQKEKGALVGALFLERLSNLAGLSHRYYSTDDPETQREAFLQFKNATKEIGNSPALFEGLEMDLNQYCSGIMEKLRNQVPRIKGDNLKVIALFFAGVPDAYIQAILNRMSTGSLRTLRSRLRSMIKDAHAPDEELFMSMLNH